jgi:ElaB/YqjD/DUF883 family membrane-anchored ribosome-binding protein
MSDQSIDTLRRDVQTLIKDAETLFHDASELGGDRATELGHKGVSMLRQALERLRTWEETAVEKGKKIAANTDHYVHEKPWYAVGIAAGFGLLLGLLISRR